jgi:hypothetical protein
MASTIDLRRDPAAGTCPVTCGSRRQLPLRSCLDLAEHDFVEVIDAAAYFSSSAGGDDAEADMLSFHQTEPQRAPHAEAERSGAVELEGGRGSGSGERQVGGWAGSRLI